MILFTSAVFFLIFFFFWNMENMCQSHQIEDGAFERGSMNMKHGWMKRKMKDLAFACMAIYKCSDFYGKSYVF